MQNRSRWRTPWQRGERRLIHGSRIDLKPKPHLTNWTLVMAIKIRRFDTQAEAEAEID
jgi:hypothetical protein